jgi:hypothetical protein
MHAPSPFTSRAASIPRGACHSQFVVGFEASSSGGRALEPTDEGRATVGERPNLSLALCVCEGGWSLRCRGGIAVVAVWCGVQFAVEAESRSGKGVEDDDTQAWHGLRAGSSVSGVAGGCAVCRDGCRTSRADGWDLQA